jgi:hypothetical protein
MDLRDLGGRQWTGYTVAVVSETAGSLALPYSNSIPRFVNPSVTPSAQLLAFLNQFGALLSFPHSGKWTFAGLALEERWSER